VGEGKGESEGIGEGEGKVKDEGKVKGEGVAWPLAVGDAEGVGEVMAWAR